MTENELKAQHPELYNAVLEKGRRGERTRVLGHLKYADASGGTKAARDAIESGASVMDKGVLAAHTVASLVTQLRGKKVA